MESFKPQSVPDPLPEPGSKHVNFDAMQEDASFEPEPGRFKQFYRNNKWYFWAIILGVVIISTLAFFAFRKQEPEPTKAAEVQVLIDAPDTSPSGDEVVYKIQVENQDTAKLEDMRLELVYDDGVSYVSSVPPAENSSNSRFSVPDMAKGESAVLMIKTTVNGDINQDKKLVARLHYKFSNFNSEFTKEVTHTVRLVAADIVLDMTGPQKATSEEKVTYDIFYRNDSEKSIDGAQVKVTYPSEFRYGESNPVPSLGQNIWNLNNLARNASGKISFNGNFKGARAGQSVAFKIEFLALDGNGTYFVQSSTTYMTSIESQPLTADLRLANNIPGNIVKPGETVQYEVKFQNNTAVAATGMNIVVDIDSKAVDMANVKADGALIQGNSITWNATSVRELERLSPDGSGSFQFTVQLNSPAVKDNSENITLVAKTRIKSNENPNFMDGNDVSLKVASPANIERAVAAVSGPIPLKVGESTILEVNVSLRNGSNDYREGVLVGYIPLGVTLDKMSISASEAAAVKFDAATGKLTWTVGQLSAHSGSVAPLRTLKFNVKVTPSNAQVNQSVALLKGVTFNAKDSFTGQSISLTSQELSSDNLPGDGSGRVRP